MDYLKAAQKAREAYREAADSLNRQLTDLKRERETIRSAWRPRADVIQRLDERLEQMAGDFAKRMASMIGTAARPDSFPAQCFHLFEGSAPGESVDPDALAYFFRDAIRARIVAAIEATDWQTAADGDQDGTDPTTRTKRLAELDAAISQLEAERDQLRASQLEAA